MGRQLADDWLDFMLSQKNLWRTFTTRGALTEVTTEKTFRKERRRLQAKHLWMEVKLRAARGSQKNPYEEKAYRGPTHKAGSNVKSGCCTTNVSVRHWFGLRIAFQREFYHPAQARSPCC